MVGRGNRRLFVQFPRFLILSGDSSPKGGHWLPFLLLHRAVAAVLKGWKPTAFGDGNQTINRRYRFFQTSQ